jgi:magnesium chelatase accessory protein
MAAPARLPADWPHREHSRSVRVGALDWHVQVMGRGPTLLLLHGSGASAHSWADLLEMLAGHATVVAPDLPGHAFTTGATAADMTLPGMKDALAALLAALKLPAPVLVAGHSAGAALALRWALSAPRPPGAVVGFNPSLVAPAEVYMQWLAPLINPVATSAPVAQMLAALAVRTGMVDSLLNSTQSVLPAAQRERYRQLFSRPEHVRGSMGFMAAADLPALLAEGARLPGTPHFIVGTRDAWVPEASLRPVIEKHFPQAKVERWVGGHVLHEEMPAKSASLLIGVLEAQA